jgi:cytochrome c-type biogenesis protein
MMLEQLWNGFLLGNASILTNVCILPLYPGMIAYLAGNAQDERAQRASGWLGVCVLGGVLTLMIAVAFVLSLINLALTSLLPIILPLIYIVVIILGVLMLMGRNPLAQLTVAQSPTARNPYLNAYLYGIMLGPMTLPCTGPIIIAAFTAGSVAGAGVFANQLLYFIAFGLGFGWPLVLLPLIARGAQRQFIGWLTRNHTLLTRISGVLLIAIGVYGFAVEVLLMGQ